MSVEPSVTTTPSGRPRQGDVLETRYELRELLASGSNADVFRARDLKLARDVAVKVLKDRAALNAAAERFSSEAATLARLSHPGIVTLLDAGSHGPTPYLVFELVEGTTLAAARHENTVEFERTGRILADLADGLAYAHAAGVIHRDVTPANILIGPDQRAQLADFGIARLLDQTTTHTRTGQLVGSPAYLAPEQVDGQPATAAVDVYALGLIVLELLTQTPEPTGSVAEVLAARAATPALPPNLDPAWRSLITDMLDQDPLRRPSAAQVAERAARLPSQPFVAADPASGTAVLDLPVPTASTPGPGGADSPVAPPPPPGRDHQWVLRVEDGAERAWRASAAEIERGWRYARQRIGVLMDWLGDAATPVFAVIGGLVLFLLIIAAVAHS